MDSCIGCGACVNVCPTEALTQADDLKANPKVRKITLRYDTCIFCGNCEDNCTTETGIKLSNKWDLAGLDRKSMAETHEYELQLCEKCGALIGTKKHLVWLYEKLGPLAYTNPSLLLAESGQLATKPHDIIEQQAGKETQPSDFMRILCPKCKYELNIRL
jgi:ferredoxin